MFQQQKTIERAVSLSGIGIHTGEKVSLKFNPAPANRGVVFRRVDLPGCPEIPALLKSVVDTSRSTSLGSGPHRIHTVEHVLAAVRAFEIDNIVIDLVGLEPPIADGSSQPFAELLEEAGSVELKEARRVCSLKEPVYHTDGDLCLVAIPGDQFKVSYTLSYPKSKLLNSQFYSGIVSKESFMKEIAPSRTFSLYEEVAMLVEAGLIKGGSLENAVVIKGDEVLCQGGLRFENEMARHKALDLIGDLTLIGSYFNAHIIAIKAGHASNVAFAKKLMKVLERDT